VYIYRIFVYSKYVEFKEACIMQYHDILQSALAITIRRIWKVIKPLTLLEYISKYAFSL